MDKEDEEEVIVEAAEVQSRFILYILYMWMCEELAYNNDSSVDLSPWLGVVQG